MPGPSIKEDIFDSDSDNDRGHSSSASSVEKIQINAKFAAQYEKKKQAEELTKHRNKLVDALDDSDVENSSYDESSSESEDEMAELLTDDLNLKILKTVHAIRNSKENPDVYDSSKRFFNDDDVPDLKKEVLSKTRSKKHYKDVIREQIMEQMDGDGEKGTLMSDRFKVHNDHNSNLAYDDEQRKLREEFLNEKVDVDDTDLEEDADFLKIRSSSNDENTKRSAEVARETENYLTSTLNTDEGLEDPRGEVKDGNAFLRDFLLNKKWIEKDFTRVGEVNDENDDLEDEEELDRQDMFESQYNFRFEESSGHDGVPQIVSYARGGAAYKDSLRRKDETRKLKRQQRKERKAEERKKKEEQLKRLRNAKKAEMQAKIRTIEEVCGKGFGENLDEATLEKMLEGDFDEEEFENMLHNELLGNEYEDGIAGAEDVKGGWNPDENRLDEEMENDEEAGDFEVHQNHQYNNDENLDNFQEEIVTSELSRKLNEKMEDALYKLDYEDIIGGDIKCRFKYQKVEANRFGLTSEELLLAPDKELNAYVSLKRMVPYRDGDEYNPGNKKRRKFRENVRDDIVVITEKVEKALNRKGKKSEAGTDETVKNAEPKKKRRRKKKGRKGENKEDITFSTEENANDQTSLEKYSGGKSIELTSLNPEENKSQEQKKKKRKRPKKSGALSVQGVSSSRLASYGI